MAAPALRRRDESAMSSDAMLPQKTSIFEVVSRLAREHGAINLGQGFPEDGFPEDVIAEAAQALRVGSNQYPPMMGLPSLRQAAAAHDAAFYGLKLDWQSQVLVTAGATEGLAATLLALLQPGDRAIVFTPTYDAYIPLIQRAGAEAVIVPLDASTWELPWKKLEAALALRPKLMVLNTPHNPTGRVCSVADLSRLAALLRTTDTLVLCDEVYEHLIFDGHKHVPLMTYEGMAERCIRLASAGKTFSLTGWKVGYAVACPALLARIAQMHQFLVFTTPPNLQTAVAYALSKPQQTFADFTAFMQRKRDRFCAALEAMGWHFTPCQGTYFVTVDTRSTPAATDDAAFCTRLVTEARVAAIPLGAFYAPEQSTPYVRFCFAKTDTMLDEAIERMRGMTW